MSLAKMQIKRLKGVTKQRYPTTIAAICHYVEDERTKNMLEFLNFGKATIVMINI